MINGVHHDPFVSLTERAYQAIVDAIARRDLKPGEPLTQDRLARWLAISRTPVREALRRLEQTGVIQTVAGRGLIVTELTCQDVEDMLEMLRLLDTRAAALAASRRTPEQGRRLIEIAEALLEAAERHDTERWAQVDKPYHETLLAAGGNRYLRDAVLDVRQRLARVTYNVAVDPAFLLQGSHEHIEVAHAIDVGDPEAAARLMNRHLEAVSRQAIRLIHDYIVPLRGERF